MLLYEENCFVIICCCGCLWIWRLLSVWIDIGYVCLITLLLFKLLITLVLMTFYIDFCVLLLLLYLYAFFYYYTNFKLTSLSLLLEYIEYGVFCDICLYVVYDYALITFIP